MPPVCCAHRLSVPIETLRYFVHYKLQKRKSFLFVTTELSATKPTPNTSSKPPNTPTPRFDRFDMYNPQPKDGTSEALTYIYTMEIQSDPSGTSTTPAGTRPRRDVPRNGRKCWYHDSERRVQHEEIKCNQFWSRNRNHPLLTPNLTPNPISAIPLPSRWNGRSIVDTLSKTITLSSAATTA